MAWRWCADRELNLRPGAVVSRLQLCWNQLHPVVTSTFAHAAKAFSQQCNAVICVSFQIGPHSERDIVYSAQTVTHPLPFSSV